MAARLLTPDILTALLRRMSPRTADAVKRARSHALGLGDPLAPMPELVFAILSEHSRPVGAYDLIDDISRLVGRPIKPPTIYRAIEQLLAVKLIARLASRNGFVACAHPGHRHDCVLLVCDRCGRTDELEDRKLDRLIDADARRTGFEPRHRTLEVEGTCRSCQPTERSGARQ